MTEEVVNDEVDEATEELDEEVRGADKLFFDVSTLQMIGGN